MSACERPIRVALDRSVALWSAEVRYVLRTLLRIAGYAHEFRWRDRSEPTDGEDVYYGPAPETSAAPVRIRFAGHSFATASSRRPRVLEAEGTCFLDFDAEPRPALQRHDDGTVFFNDLVLACYWLLTGGGEAGSQRDRWDNVCLGDSPLVDHDLLTKPLVSLYGAMLRAQLEFAGATAAACPWSGARGGAAFVLSHDVDYPEIIRWVECLRLLKARGAGAFPSIAGVLNGSNHFWKFSDWIEAERALGTRPAFYFMARRGSLARYAAGTPDAFYDIEAPRFAELFRQLRDEGCEIGLHASYHAHRSVRQLVEEKQRLERAAEVQIEGNRHHYWHLDPEQPHDTLLKHEHAGLAYDSSLALEFYPGFRRGICHPFRVFHPRERRELDVVQLPPAWMDDHFDRRLERNRIADPDGYARELVAAAGRTGGTVIVDYHARGMNADFYPRYGPWLLEFLQRHEGLIGSFRQPREICALYRAHEAALEARSRDLTVPAASVTVARPLRIDVGLLEPHEHAAWSAFVAAHPQRTIYHTLNWRSVTEEGLGHRGYFLRARAAGSGAITGVLPLFLVTGLWGRRLVSVPMRDRGGLLATDAESASRLIERATALSRDLGCRYVELRSLWPLDASLRRQHGLLTNAEWTTTRIDLSPGVSHLWSALDKNAVRWAINNARRNGVHVDLDDTARGMELFHRLFFRTRRALGIPCFPKALFQAIWRHLVAAGDANLFLVRKGDEPIGGLLNLLSGDTVVAAYAAPQRSWAKLHPSEVAIWHAIEWAARNRFAWFDFGADSPRQESLLWFKRKWGGVPQPVFYSYVLNDAERVPDFDSSSATYVSLRKAWARLPLPLAATVGPWLTRQMS